jgi:hypothetical protein
MGGGAAGATAFAAAALVMVALTFGLALVVASAQERTVAALRAGAGRVRRWGGFVLVGVGAWTLASAIFVDAFRLLLF